MELNALDSPWVSEMRHVEGVFCCPWTTDKQQWRSLSLFSVIPVCIYANKLVRTTNQPLLGFSNKGEYVHCMWGRYLLRQLSWFFVFLRKILMSPADSVNKPEGNCPGSAARHTNGDVTLKEKCVMLGYICTFRQSFSPTSHAILTR